MDKLLYFSWLNNYIKAMSDIKEYPIEEKKLGDWSNVAELIDFKIVRTIKGGLLGMQMADVLFIYKKSPGQTDAQQKHLHLYGPEGLVWKRAIDIISRKKNHRQRAEMIDKFNKAFEETKFTPFSSTPSGTLLGRAIKNTGFTARQFAEKTGLKAPTLYHHVSGGREISREIAMEYAEKLNCDPVDLMFDKKMCPVWAKVDLLKATELEDVYNPGRLFSYAAEAKDFENVIVPRDLYREDIKAIKITARGSMYDNKIAFYYRAENKENNILNQLCVVGVEVPVGPVEFTNDTETRYYFGLYEEVRGQCNLINPDPYSGDLENKFILKNFTPEFITPVAALVNPDAVKDQTDLKKTIPQSALFRREEMLAAELEKTKKLLLAKDKYEEDLGDVVKATKEQARKIKAQAELQMQTALEHEKKLREEMKKISQAIEKQMYQEKKSILATSKSLFEKAVQSNERRTKLHIVGKKN
jgi:hypothetical protein